MGLSLRGSTSGSIDINPPAVAGNNTITLPGDNGSANQFFRNSTTAGIVTYSSMVEDSSGNIGIGTDNPQTSLVVERDWVNNYGSINIKSSSDVLSGVGFRTDGGYVGGFIYRDGTTGNFFELNAQGSRDIRALLNGSEALRITSSGNFGIGTTNPGTKLNVHGTISTGKNLAREFGTVIDWSSQFNTYRSASNVISGDKNHENASKDWLTAGYSRVNAYVTIDLGNSYTVDRLVVYNQNEYSNSRREVKQFTLQGSNDNSTWTTIIVNECGKSNATEPNPGWSFRLPDNWADDDEGRTWRYWKFIMNTFHGSDPYGGVMEIELYGANDSLDDELSTSSLVAQDVYSETGNFGRGITVGYGYGGENSVADGAIIEGNVGIGTINTFGQSTPIYTYSPILGVQGSIIIGNLSSTDTDRHELQFYRRGGSTPATPISTHDMGRIAWYGSSNDSDNANLAWSIGVNPDGGGWTSGANRKGYMTFNNHDGEQIRIKSDGNVGIGTANPQNKLHVIGSIKVESGIFGETKVSGTGYTANTNLDITGFGYGNYFVNIRTTGVYHWNGILAVTMFDTADFGVSTLVSGNYSTTITASMVNLSAGNGTLRLIFNRNFGGISVSVTRVG